MGHTSKWQFHTGLSRFLAAAGYYWKWWSINKIDVSNLYSMLSVWSSIYTRVFRLIIADYFWLLYIFDPFVALFPKWFPFKEGSGTPRDLFVNLGPLFFKVPFFLFFDKRMQNNSCESLYPLLTIPVSLLFLMTILTCRHFASNFGKNRNWSMYPSCRVKVAFFLKLGPLLIPFLNFGCELMLFFNFAWKLMPPFWDCLKILMGSFTIFWLSRTDSFRIPQIGGYTVSDFFGQIFIPVGNSAMVRDP